MAGGLVCAGAGCAEVASKCRTPFWLKLAPAPLRCPFSDGTSVILGFKEGYVIRRDRLLGEWRYFKFFVFFSNLHWAQLESKWQIVGLPGDGFVPG